MPIPIECPICKGTNTQFLGLLYPKNDSIFLCKDCGLLFNNSSKIQNISKIPEKKKEDIPQKKSLTYPA